MPEASLPPSDRTAPTTPIPDPAGPVIGRSEEVAAVMALFDRGARLVTLLGAPGIGKTRMALELAGRFHDRLPGGARFVALAGVAEPTGLAPAIGDALGITVPAGDEGLEPLVDGLRAQEILLVLDNFEHLAPAAPLVGELLARSPALRVLVTGRQPLELSAETEFSLPPLALPERTDEPPERLAEVAAVALFVARAGRVRPGFVLDDSNAAAVAQICARLDGIPLAIELAAGAAKFLAPPAILAQLGHGLDLPVAGPLDAPEHHRTLRRAIGWSFDLLGPDEHALMSRLGVFVGGFTLEAVEGVCRLSPREHLDPRAGVLGLAAKSLLEPRPEEAATRFELLEAVRAYALECLEELGELDQFQCRHAGWFLSLAEANEQRLTGPDQAEALAVLEAEHANLRAAIQWSLDRDPGTAIRMCAALWRFWWIRGHLAEGRRWLAAALAGPQDDDAAHARARTGAGVLARTQGDYTAAVELLERGAHLSRSIDDQGALALALLNLGIVAEDLARHREAAALFEELRDVYAALGDDRGVGHSLNCLGTVRLAEGELDAAAVLYEEALDIFRKLDDDWSVALVLTNLGWLAHKQGRHEVARSCYEKGLAMYRALGDDRGVAHMLVNLGIASRPDGGARQVAGLFEEALLTFARLGERRGVAECVETLAAGRSGDDPRGAAVLLGAADAIRRAIGAPLWPDEEAEQARLVDDLRASLGDSSFDASWHAGRMMQLDEIVAVALTERDEPSPP